jgi:hypothetical protein
MLRILSLGAGVQSTTLALMAARGDVEPIDAAIFADTQSEPAGVYRHLERLMAPGVLPFPVHVVTKGSLRQELLEAAAGKNGAWGRPPLYLLNPDGTHGQTRRQCTQDYKLDVIYRKVRELAGIKRGSHGPKAVVVEQVIGISRDEAHRQKDARFRWIRNIYPLVERGITREDCQRLLQEWGWRDVPRSACTFCPYRSDEEWLRMQREDPASFEDAARIDDVLRSGLHHQLRGEPYLHRALIPLRLVDFEARIQAKKARRKPGSPWVAGDLFGQECEGMCGV